MVLKRSCRGAIDRQGEGAAAARIAYLRRPVLFTYFHLAADAELTRELMASGALHRL
jgi:hypothetical protein